MHAEAAQIGAHPLAAIKSPHTAIDPPENPFIRPPPTAPRAVLTAQPRDMPSESHSESPKIAHPASVPVSTGPGRRAGWSVLGISVAVSALAVVLFQHSGPNRGPTTLVPTYYAVCGKIYTVDQKNSQAECIVVNETRILAVESLGEPFDLSPTRKKHSRPT